MTAILTANLSVGSVKKPIRNLRPGNYITGWTSSRRNSYYFGFQFDLVWTYRPYTDVQTVDAFFLANMTNQFDYDWPLEPGGPYSEYTCIFAQEPHYRPTAYSLWDIKLTLYWKIKI